VQKGGEKTKAERAETGTVAVTVTVTGCVRHSKTTVPTQATCFLKISLTKKITSFY